MNNNEYLFQHKSGHFTGIIKANDGKMFQVKLTSRAKSNIGLEDGDYQVGEMRWVNANTPKHSLSFQPNN